MKEKHIFSKTIELKVYSYDALPKEWQGLCRQAKTASLTAYAAYSKFRVGAAVLLEDGDIVCGNNQENAAYPSGLCAERTALFYAHSKYPDKKIKGIAIYSPDATSLLTPCGACRQVMLEYENLQKENFATIIVSDKDVHILFSAKDWLPFEFSENLLK